jgi:hypothetical protein
MKLSDGLRQGDRVLVEATVRHDPDEEGVFLDVGNNTYSPLRVSIESVKSPVRRKWKIEEIVCEPGSRISGKVIAIHDDFVWVQWLDVDVLETMLANAIEPHKIASQPENVDE